MYVPNNTPLKVLNPALTERLRVFNQAARALQFMNIRLLRVELNENRLTIDPNAGQQLLNTQQLISCQRQGSAGSTLYLAQFQGVTLQWREPISASRPEEWARPIIH